MADKTVSLELKIDASGAAQSVGDLKKSIQDLKNQALRAGEDSVIGRQFIAEAGKAKDRLSDLIKQVDAFQDSGSKFGAVTKLVGSLAGGFQAAQGAAALFGASGEALQATLVKVQAATAAAQGIQAIAGITDEIGAVKKIALATASNIAGAAAKLFGITTAQAMAVASAGLTVVIGAVIALISYFASASAASEELAKAEEARKEKAKRRAENLSVYDKKDIENAQFKIELLKKQGASTALILKAENDLLDLKLKQNQAAMDATDASAEGDKKFNELSIERTKLQNQKILLNTKEHESIKLLTENGAVGSIGYYNFLLSESNNQLNKLVPGSAAYNAELQKNLDIQTKLNAANEIANGITEAKQTAQKPLTETAPKPIEALTAPLGVLAVQTAEDKKRAIRKQALKNLLADKDAQVAIATGTLSILSSLGAIGIKNAEKAAKFQKKLAVAQILVDTASGISNAIQSGKGIPFPANIPIITGAVAMVLANAAKAKSILSKAGDVSVPSLDSGGAVGAGGGAVGGAPELTQPTTNIPQGQGGGSQQQSQPVLVVETYQSAAHRVNVIEQRATFR